LGFRLLVRLLLAAKAHVNAKQRDGQHGFDAGFAAMTSGIASRSLPGCWFARRRPEGN